MKRRLISIDQMLSEAKQSFLRFPLSLLCAFTAGVLMVIFVERENYARDVNLWRYILTALLGIPSFFVLVLVSEVRKWGRNTTVVANGVLLALLVAYFFTLPYEPTEKIAVIYRYLMLSIAAHAAVAFLPFWREEGVNGFWQFNKSLFLRIFTASLYSGVLTAGLMIALAACDYLLGFNIESENYAEIAILIQLFFHPWFFFAGVPKDLTSLKDVHEYPKGLKVFAQFILMSLVMIYLVILYAYGLKIIMSWNWPKGLVSQLILWYSVVGILSLLLLWPLREKEESRWVGRYTKWFFVTLLPLLVMLFLAILQRVGDYGITVNRHVVLALASGLAIVTIYFILSKHRDIRSIPMVLCLVALLSAYGPLSAESVSIRSQGDRLRRLTMPDEVSADSTNQNQTNAKSDNLKEAESIARYMGNWHGRTSFKGFVSDSFYVATKDLSPGMIEFEIGDDVESGRQRKPYQVEQSVSILAKDCDLMDITSFEYFVPIDLEQEGNRGGSSSSSALGDSMYVILKDSSSSLAFDWFYRGEQSSDAVTIDLSPDFYEHRASKFTSNNPVPCSLLVFPIVGKSFSAELMVKYVYGTIADSTVSIERIVGFIAIRNTR